MTLLVLHERDTAKAKVVEEWSCMIAEHYQLFSHYRHPSLCISLYLCRSLIKLESASGHTTLNLVCYSLFFRMISSPFSLAASFFRST